MPDQHSIVPAYVGCRILLHVALVGAVKSRQTQVVFQTLVCLVLCGADRALCRVNCVSLMKCGFLRPRRNDVAERTYPWKIVREI